MMREFAIFFPFLAALIVGCASKPAPIAVVANPPPIQVTPSAEVQHLSSSPASDDDHPDRNAPHNDGDIILQLDIYQITAPAGAISTNEQFWKRIDEDHVDLETHARLMHNGVRFGIGPNSEWDYYKSLIERYGATARQGSTSAVRKGSIELSMRLDIDEEDIFYIDDAWKSAGRTYLKCENALALTFEPTPRQPGDATIEACAVIRGLRTQWEVTLLNDTREISYRRPEFLYDLRLRQNVPADHFLVLSPSSAASRETSLGYNFFYKTGIANLSETVIILVPRIFHVTAKTTRRLSVDRGQPTSTILRN